MMSQTPSSPCPRCRAPIPANQQFCSNCGVTLHIESRGQTPLQPTQRIKYPVHVSAQSYQAPQYNAYAQQSHLGYAAALPYVIPQKNAEQGTRRKVGCGMGIALMLLVVLLATAGYFAIRFIGPRVTNGPTDNSAVTPTQGPVTTTPINTTVTYASVVITIINAQQAKSFANDPESSDLLRLNLHEQNTVTVDTSLVPSTSSYAYADAFRLLLPDGKSLALLDSQTSSGPARGITQNSWVDFPIPISMKVNQLLLRLGTDTETQMDIPLIGNADVSQYQPEQVVPNKQVQYGSLMVALTTATALLSYGGEQADKGMRFLVVALTIVNSASSDVHAYPPDYLRLQLSGTTIAPEGSTAIPNAFAASATAKGTAAFLVPQNETTFTLLLLANDSTGATSQAAIPFQIQ